MRFMCIVQHKEGPVEVPPALFEAINKLGEEAAKSSCVMVSRGGLLPTAEGTRIALKGGKISVTDGPFAEVVLRHTVAGSRELQSIARHARLIDDVAKRQLRRTGLERARRPRYFDTIAEEDGLGLNGAVGAD